MWKSKTNGTEPKKRMRTALSDRLDRDETQIPFTKTVQKQEVKCDTPNWTQQEPRPTEQTAGPGCPEEGAKQTQETSQVHGVNKVQPLAVIGGSSGSGPV